MLGGNHQAYCKLVTLTLIFFRNTGRQVDNGMKLFRLVVRTQNFPQARFSFHRFFPVLIARRRRQLCTKRCESTHVAHARTAPVAPLLGVGVGEQGAASLSPPRAAKPGYFLLAAQPRADMPGTGSIGSGLQDSCLTRYWEIGIRESKIHASRIKTPRVRESGDPWA